MEVACAHSDAVPRARGAEVDLSVGCRGSCRGSQPRAGPLCTPDPRFRGPHVTSPPCLRDPALDRPRAQLADPAPGATMLPPFLETVVGGGVGERSHWEVLPGWQVASGGEGLGGSPGTLKGPGLRRYPRNQSPCFFLPTPFPGVSANVL